MNTHTVCYFDFHAHNKIRLILLLLLLLLVFILRHVLERSAW